MPPSTPVRLFLLAVLAAAPAFADGPYLSVSASETWQSNVNNAPPPDVTRSAWSTGVTAGSQWIESLDFGTLLIANLGLDASDCTTFHGLNFAELDGALAVRHKFGLGAYATVISLAAEGSASQYQDTERSVATADLALTAGQRINAALQVEGTAHVGGYSARNDVFSGSWADAGLTLNWDVTETWRAKLIGGWRNGDVVTTYSAYGGAGDWEPEDPGALVYSRPFKFVSTFGAPYLAYRLRGRTLQWGAALAPAIGQHTTLLLQLLRCETQGYDLYFNNVVSVSVSHEF